MRGGSRIRFRAASDRRQAAGNKTATWWSGGPGFVQCHRNRKDGVGRTDVYSEAIDAGIANPNKTGYLERGAFFRRPIPQGSLARTPEMVSVDREHGGGVTYTDPEGRLRTVLSGAGSTVTGADGLPLDMKSDEEFGDRLSVPHSFFPC